MNIENFLVNVFNAEYDYPKIVMPTEDLIALLRAEGATEDEIQRFLNIGENSDTKDQEGR